MIDSTSLERSSSRTVWHGTLATWRFGILAVVASLLLGSGVADAKVIYVNHAKPLGGDGNSWNTAFKYVQDALLVTAVGDTIYVAKGTYYPDEGGSEDVIVGDREISFEFNGVKVYGGFAGNEVSLDQRDIKANPTIFSGEIWPVTPETLGYERYWSLHVVIAQGDVTLDGLTVEKGRANGNEHPANQGGGCYVRSGQLTLANCTFSENLAADSGGAIFGTVVATDCTFADNEVNNEYLYAPSSPKQKHWLYSPDCSGGAIQGNVTASGCNFFQNRINTESLDLGNKTSATGGAISGSTIVLNDCVFNGNGVISTSYPLYSAPANSDATTRGGAVSGGDVTAVNCNFIQNEAISISYANASAFPKDNTYKGYKSIPTSLGGAVAGKVSALNCSFSLNVALAKCAVGDEPQATCLGAAMYVEGNSAVTNCVFSKGTARTTDLTPYFSDNSFVRTRGNLHVASAATLPVANSTFVNNVSTGLGAAISCDGSVNVISNIFWYDTNDIDKAYLIHVNGKGSISNRLYPTPSTETLNIIRGGYAAITSGLGSDVDFGEPPERTLIDQNPQFLDIADPNGPDNIWRTGDDGYRLRSTSPALGLGQPAFLPSDSFDLDDDGNLAERLPVDAAQFKRVQGGGMELGAYERGNILVIPEITVKLASGKILVDGGSSINLSATAGVPQTFVILNKGLATLKNLQIAVNGANPGDFDITQPGVNSLGAKGSTTFTVTFNPTTQGPRSVSLQIASNDADENPFDITIEGQAPLPDIAVEQPAGSPLVDGAAVDFGPVGTESSLSKTFVIQNTGAGVLALAGITLSGPDAAYFVASAPGKTTLDIGDSTTFEVTFTPTGLGDRAALLVINSNDPDAESSFEIDLTGKGRGAPEIIVSHPTSPEFQDGDTIRYGSVPKGTLFGKTIVIKNGGLTALKDISITLTGAAAFTKTDFPVTRLAPGESAKFEVTFKPTSVGKKTALLQISSNDGNEGNFELNLIGIGEPASSGAASSGLASLSGWSGLSSSAADLSATVGTVSTITKSGGSSYLVLTVTKSGDWSSSKHVVEVSSNLVDWCSGPDFTTTLLNNKDVLSVRDNTPLKQGEKRYIRLR